MARAVWVATGLPPPDTCLLHSLTPTSCTWPGPGMLTVCWHQIELACLGGLTPSCCILFLLHHMYGQEGRKKGGVLMIGGLESAYGQQVKY